MAKARQKARQDVRDLMVIMDEGRMLSEVEEVKKRWREYFGKLLNEENPLEELEDVNPIEGPIADIIKREGKEAPRGMKRDKSGGPSEVAMEMLKALGGKGELYIRRLLELIWAEERTGDSIYFEKLQKNQAFGACDEDHGADFG